MQVAECNLVRRLLMHGIVFGVVCTFGVLQTRAQSPTTTDEHLPSFEVASIRPNPGPWHILRGYQSSGPMVTLEAYTVSDLIEEAYGLKHYQVTTAEPQTRQILHGTYYNIVAKAEGDGTPTRAQFRLMMQSLLEDRFNLKFHREMKTMPVYALVVGKHGPKFQKSAADAVSTSRVGVNGRNQTLTLAKATVASLADDIGNAFGVDRPILDETELTGTYDINLEATPEFRINRRSDPGDISIFTAVQEQLGLKLEPTKAPVQVLVIDHIETPSEN